MKIQINSERFRVDCNRDLIVRFTNKGVSELFPNEGHGIIRYYIDWARNIGFSMFFHPREWQFSAFLGDYEFLLDAKGISLDEGIDEIFYKEW